MPKIIKKNKLFIQSVNYPDPPVLFIEHES